MEVGRNQINLGLSKLKAGLKPLSEVVSTQLLIWNKNGSMWPDQVGQWIRSFDQSLVQWNDSMNAEDYLQKGTDM